MACVSDCLDMSPPPDTILFMPPPPAPQFMFPNLDSYNATNCFATQSCDAAAAFLNHKGNFRNLDRIEYIEMPSKGRWDSRSGILTETNPLQKRKPNGTSRALAILGSWCSLLRPLAFCCWALCWPCSYSNVASKYSASALFSTLYIPHSGVRLKENKLLAGCIYLGIQSTVPCTPVR